MTQQIINIGTTYNDKSGDLLRDAFQKINTNFAELYAATAADVQIPSQTSHNGQYLTTNGSTLSWGSITAIPSQSTHNGQYLTTDGTNLSWGTVSAVVSQLTNGSATAILDSSGNISMTNGGVIKAAPSGFTGFGTSNLSNFVYVNDSGFTLSTLYTTSPHNFVFDQSGNLSLEKLVLTNGVIRSTNGPAPATYSINGASREGSFTNPIISFTTTHSLNTGDIITVSGVTGSGGVTAVNGTWYVQFRSASSVRLYYTAALNTYPDATTWVYSSGGVAISSSPNDINLIAGTVASGAGDGNVNIKVNNGTSRYWQFKNDGSITFPDATSQTTAWTGSVAASSLTGTTLNNTVVTFASTTTTQSVAIANGVTASGQTNTINIGTGGATGSTTAIAIGSQSGTSTTQINGVTNHIGAVKFNAALQSGGGATNITMTNNGPTMNGTTTFSSYTVNTVSATVTAGTAGQATATALASTINVITNAASAGLGVALPTGVAGYIIYVYNAGANAINVYPVNGGTAQINAVGTNNPYSLATNTGVRFVCATANQWYTI